MAPFTVSYPVNHNSCLTYMAEVALVYRLKAQTWENTVLRTGGKLPRVTAVCDLNHVFITSTMDEFIDKIGGKQTEVARSDKHQVLSTGWLVGPIRKHCRLTCKQRGISNYNWRYHSSTVCTRHTAPVTTRSILYKLTYPSGMYTWEKWATFLITAQ